MNLSEYFSVDWAKETLKSPNSKIISTDIAIQVLHENSVPEEEITKLYGDGIFSGLQEEFMRIQSNG